MIITNSVDLCEALMASSNLDITCVPTRYRDWIKNTYRTMISVEYGDLLPMSLMFESVGYWSYAPATDDQYKVTFDRNEISKKMTLSAPGLVGKLLPAIEGYIIMKAKTRGRTLRNERFTSKYLEELRKEVSARAWASGGVKILLTHSRSLRAVFDSGTKVTLDPYDKNNFIQVKYEGLRKTITYKDRITGFRKIMKDVCKADALIVKTFL